MQHEGNHCKTAVRFEWAQCSKTNLACVFQETTCHWGTMILSCTPLQWRTTDFWGSSQRWKTSSTNRSWVPCKTEEPCPGRGKPIHKVGAFSYVIVFVQPRMSQSAERWTSYPGVSGSILLASITGGSRRGYCQYVLPSNGPFTQSISISVSGNANVNTQMDVVLIHFAAGALLLMLMLCVNRLIQYWKSHWKDNANVLCEPAIRIWSSLIREILDPLLQYGVET